MFIPQKSLKNFGLAKDQEEIPSFMTRFLKGTGMMAFNRTKIILLLTMIVVVAAGWGISRIQINDNPTKWFARSHPIRVADRVLNDHFGGTYMAYLVLEPQKPEDDPAVYSRKFLLQLKKYSSKLQEDYPRAPQIFGELGNFLADEQKTASSPEDLLDRLAVMVANRMDQAPDEEYDAWEAASLFLDKQRQLTQTFKDPRVLEYMAGLQKDLLKTGIVGKTNSLTDIVKTVHRELFTGKEEAFRVPGSRGAVAQCLLTYQNSHRPHDLWHFVTPDYRKSSIWVQLKSGDNKDMVQVVEAVEKYLKNNPPPVPLKHKWFGLTYINIIWQEKMVKGMLQAFMGSFLIVFLMTSILFRSPLWGLLAMIPLTVTIGFIYGAVGILGKDYDMPVAVLSSLSLGLAVDFAIHFLSRSRRVHAETGSWRKATEIIFGEPARAITRNVMVVAFGFLPLLAATLVPYKTVGIFLASIMAVSGIATLIILPALVKTLEKRLFPIVPAMGAACNCALCIASSTTLVLLVALNLHQYARIGFSTLTWISLAAIPVLAFVCGFMSRREKCMLSGQ